MSLPGGVRSRVKLRALVLIIAVLCIGGAVAAHITLRRIASPDLVCSRLEALLGCPVEVGTVSLRPWRLEARVRGFKADSYTTIDDIEIRFQPAAALAGKWRLRKVKITEARWTVPAAPDRWESFLKGALSPIWIARHADSVELESGTVMRSEEGGPLASAIHGEFSRCWGPNEKEGATPGSSHPVDAETSGRGSFPGECVLAQLRGFISSGEEFSLETSCMFSEAGDSLILDPLRLSTPSLDLECRAVGALRPRPEVALNVTASRFHGGTMELSALLRDLDGLPSLKGRAQIRGADARALAQSLSELRLLQSGTVDAEIDLAGGGSEWWKRGLSGVISAGSAELTAPVLDPSGPLVSVIPAGISSGRTGADCVRARFEISEDRVLVHEFAVTLGGAEWRGSGTIGNDGALAGLVLGRVSAAALGSAGSALALVAGLLADDDGRVPVAFRVGGTVENALLSVDLDAVAEEAARAGRPEAKGILRAMSGRDRERLRLTLDELLLGPRSAGR